MMRHFLISVVLLALVFIAPAYAADKSSGDATTSHGAHLSCFSIISPAALATLSPERQANSRRGWIAQSSCDAMCAAQDAACVGGGAFTGVDECAATATASDFEVCRCCGIGK
jgi:hypothetical protein